MKTCLICNNQFDRKVSNEFRFCSNSCSEKYYLEKKIRDTQKIRNRESEKERSNPDYHYEKSWRAYKNKANWYDDGFDLTIEDFKNPSNLICYYCGDTQLKVIFDRVDNNRGYIKSNVVPSCKVCNFMKLARTQEDFILNCIKVAKKHLTTN